MLRHILSMYVAGVHVNPFTNDKFMELCRYIDRYIQQ